MDEGDCSGLEGKDFYECGISDGVRLRRDGSIFTASTVWSWS